MHRVRIREDIMRGISAVAVFTLTILGLPALAVTQEEPVHAVSGGGDPAPGWRGPAAAPAAGRGRRGQHPRRPGPGAGPPPAPRPPRPPPEPRRPRRAGRPGGGAL